MIGYIHAHDERRRSGITPEYPTHPTVLGLELGLGSRLGLGIRAKVRYVCRV